jgi:mono/diheme cytochrome c family protein
MQAYITGIVAALFAVAAWGQTAPGSIERGRKLYLDNWCHTCHGTVGQGGERAAGPRIAPNPFPYEGFVQQTRRPRANMPRYPVEFLSDQDLADIYAYVASIKPAPAARNIPLLGD